MIRYIIYLQILLAKPDSLSRVPLQHEIASSYLRLLRVSMLASNNSILLFYFSPKNESDLHTLSLPVPMGMLCCGSAAWAAVRPVKK